MKKLLVLVLALSLGGCVTDNLALNLITAVKAVTVGVDNPVTKSDLNAFENSMIVAFAGLNAYKKACIRGAADVNCRANVAKVQVYTRKLPAALATTRGFVKSGDQVNAVKAYATAKQLFNDFTADATANNIKVQ